VRQCAAVRLVEVYGSARGSVRLFGSAAVCGSVHYCEWHCERQCAGCSVQGSVRQVVVVCGSAHGRVRAARRVRAAVCGSVPSSRVDGRAAVLVWQCTRQCAAVRAAVCGSVRSSVWQCAR
jgi:hypothetical protein